MKILLIIVFVLAGQRICAQEKVYKVHESHVSNSSGQFDVPVLYKFAPNSPGPNEYITGMAGNFNPTRSFFLVYTTKDVDTKVTELKDSISNLQKKLKLLSDTLKIQKDQLRITFKNAIDNLPKAILIEEVVENMRKNLLDEVLNTPLADLKKQVSSQEKAIAELRKLLEKNSLKKKTSH